MKIWSIREHNYFVTLVQFCSSVTSLSTFLRCFTNLFTWFVVVTTFSSETISMKSGLCFSLLISFFSFLSSWFVIFEFKLIVPAIHFSYFVIFLEIFRKSAINYSPLPVMFGISLNSFSEFLFSVFY